MKTTKIIIEENIKVYGKGEYDLSIENPFQKWFSEEEKEKLRKDIRWELQHCIKGEYNIYQIKKRINNLFLERVEEQSNRKLICRICGKEGKHRHGGMS